MCTAVINESKNMWIKRNVIITLGLVLPGENLMSEPVSQTLQRKCFLSEVNNATFGGHCETTRSTRKTLDLNSTELYCMLQASLLHYQFLSFEWMKTSNARSSYFPRLLSGEFVLSVALVMNMLLYTFSPQWPHFNGLQQHFNPSKPVKTADLIKYCQWWMSFFLNRQT